MAQIEGLFSFEYLLAVIPLLCLLIVCLFDENVCP